jgi:hypothetical protein
MNLGGQLITGFLALFLLYEIEKIENECLKVYKSIRRHLNNMSLLKS